MRLKRKIDKLTYLKVQLKRLKPFSIRDTRSYIQPNTKTLEDMINYLAAIREILLLSVDKNKMLLAINIQMLNSKK
jgi:hypothetical protein